MVLLSNREEDGNFYPRPPRGGRPHTHAARLRRPYFYPRPPRGGRPEKPSCRHRMDKFLSTSSARRTTLAGLFKARQGFHISIHVLREEDDLGRTGRNVRRGIYFYPRPPRGGRRGDIHLLYLLIVFLSTSSARRTTGMTTVIVCATLSFLSTSSARRTTQAPQPVRPAFPFLSTSSARRTTLEHQRLDDPVNISIHVLREEDDGSKRYKADNFLYFYPRPPRGGRQSREAR